MGVIQSFERRLQGAVGNTFARLFGGGVHPAEVMDALQAEAAEHLQDQNGRHIAPNSYTVRLGRTDRDGLGQDDAKVAAALSDTVREYLAEQGWQTFGDVAVVLEQSDSLHTGQFRVRSTIDPDIIARSGRLTVTDEPGPGAHPQGGQQPPAGAHPGARPAAQPGVGTMTQQPHDPNRPYYPPQQPQQGQPYYPPQPQQPYPPQQPPQQQPPAYDPNAYPPQQPGYPQPGYEQPQYDQPQYDQPPAYDPYAQPAPQYGQPGYEQQYAQPQYDEYQQYAPQPAPDIVCMLQLDDGSGRRHQLVRGSNVVGRGQDANFRLPDTSVSRRHIDIYFDGQVAVMHDLGSTNGTTVNGTGVQTWQLADGDVIRIGHSAIIFNLHG